MSNTLLNELKTEFERENKSLVAYTEYVEEIRIRLRDLEKAIKTLEGEK